MEKVKTLEDLIKKEEKIRKKLKLVKSKMEKRTLKLSKKLDIIDNLKDEYLMFDLNDLATVLANLISIWKDKEYVVEKACYISTSRIYNTNGENYIPVFQYDALLIISKDCLQQESKYYDYYIDQKIKSREVLILNKSNNAREVKSNLVTYSGYYDDNNMKLEFKDKSNFSGNGVISIKEEDFDKFKYAYRFVEYLIDKRVEFKKINLEKISIYKTMIQFLKEKMQFDYKAEEVKKTI
jgi:hypothetical protein